MKELFAWAGKEIPAASGGAWEPVERGGSDRLFWRGRGAASGIVAVSYGAEKRENSCYAACAAFLLERGIRVPRVLGHDPQRRFLLLEDAGSEDLWSHREAGWERRRDLYLRALEQAARMHVSDLAAAESAGLLQQPFDESLYEWEQDYFREHFLGREFSAAERDALREQARRLAARPRVLLHRDFQSQNIMVRGGQVCLLDFQGMRAGLAGYDVASLLYDPYVDLSADERNELSAAYAAMAGRSDAGDWGRELRACGRQRLMQALGAYGFLGHVKGRAQFLQHIPSAAARLAELCEPEPAWQSLAGSIREAATRHA